MKGLGSSFQVSIQAFDVFFEGLDAFVDAAAQKLVGEEAEPAFDPVDPGRAGRGEVQMEARVLGQPVVDRWCFVGGEVVAHQVHVEFDRHGLVDRGEELFEFHCTVAAVDLGDHGAVGDVECGEQAGDPWRA